MDFSTHRLHFTISYGQSMAVLDELTHIATVERLVADGVPSASIAVLDDGNISAHVITNREEDTNTVYQAASISKAITALAVAKLIDDGRFSYDTRVAEHLPHSVTDCVVGPATAHLVQHVTVRMLVSHTSGLSQHGFPGYAGTLPSAEDVLAGRGLSNTPKVRFNSFPGAQYSYSGGGFTLLQLFLEHVMQLPFPQIMQDIVLQPLGMARSHYGALSDNEQNYAKAHWTAHTQTGAEYHHFAELAAAGLWTTPSDLLKAVAAVQESLHTESGFLKQETAKQMLTRSSQTDALVGMALGWAADDAMFSHRGDNDPGYSCYFFGFHGGVVNTRKGKTETKVPLRGGVAVMTNTLVGFETIRKIVSAVFYLQGWPRLRVLPGHFGTDDYVPYAAPEGTDVDDSWRDWTGRWGSDWQIVDDHGPKLAFQDSPPMLLRPAAAPIGDGEHCLVVNGLECAIRLVREEKEYILELIQCEGVQRLRRKYQT